jgi:hypothetical protein
VSEDYLLFARTRPVLDVTNRTGCSGAAVRMRALTAHDEDGFNSSTILMGLQIRQAHLMDARC